MTRHGSQTYAARPADISVVVCTYNRADMLRVAVDSLFHLETGGLFTYEIVVVDDASTDGTASMLAALAADAPLPIRVIRGSGAGIAAARNAGIDEARGAYVAFFDDDQIAEASWLIELWRTLKDSGAACVGGARTLDLPADRLEALPPIIRLYLGEIPVESEVRPCGRASLPCTGAVLMERRVFQAAGHFDASLIQGGEDTEFFARVLRAGLPCWYTPRSIARHMVPAYRLQEPYLKWAAIRGGECFAHRDALEWGAARLCAAACARVAHAALAHGAMMAVASIAGARQETLARKCQIQRALAYARVAGRLALRRRAHAMRGSAIEFRSERNLFSKYGQ